MVIVDRCGVLPLVCKKWYQLTKKPSVMWRSIVIEPTISTSAHIGGGSITKIYSVLRWLDPRASSVQEMWLRLLDYNNHDFENKDLGRIFKMVSSNLQALHVLNCGEIMSRDGFLSMSILTRYSLCCFLHMEKEFCLHYIEILLLLGRLRTLSIRNWGPKYQVNAQDLDNLSKLSDLKSLTLEVDIDGFPCSLINLEELEELTLLKCQNLEIPASIIKLAKLKSLTIVECGLRQLSTSICRLTGLEVLNLGMNQLGRDLDSLPADMLNLGALKELGLCCNEYDTIPDVVFKLSSLQVCCQSSSSRVCKCFSGFILNLFSGARCYDSLVIIFRNWMKCLFPHHFQAYLFFQQFTFRAATSHEFQVLLVIFHH